MAYHEMELVTRNQFHYEASRVRIVGVGEKVASMSDAPFVMTYPCYFALSPVGAPELVEVDGKLSICLFTDHDTAERFHAHWHGKRGRGFQVIPFDSRDSLLKGLKSVRPQLDEQGVGQIALDPLPGGGKRIVYAELDDFAAGL